MKILTSNCNIYAFIAALLPATFGSGYASAAEGSMSCVVKSNAVTAVREGKPYAYTGFVGKTDAGDTLTLTYSRIGNESVSVDLTDMKRNQTFVFGYYRDLQFVKSGGLRVGDLNSGAYLTPDFIHTWDATGDFVLTRYYKNDWQGYFVQNIPVELTVQVVTLDCRTTIDGLAEILSQEK